MIYCVLYASTSDSRWHECGHGTAFKTDWMNNALYEIASFMVMRESTVWRWSHNRHHSDTIIVGRDPEIAVPRPPDLKAIIMGFFNLRVYPKYFKSDTSSLVWAACPPRKRPSSLRSDFRRSICERASTSSSMRRHWACYLLAQYLPLMFVGLSNLFGSWLLLGLWPDATRRPGRKRARSPPQLPHGLHESDQPVSLLEHELPRRAPHVPAGALPRTAKAACRREGRFPNALPESFAAWREIIPAISGR